LRFCRPIFTLFFALFFTCLLLGSLGRISLGSGEANIYLYELVVGGMLGYWGFVNRHTFVGYAKDGLARAIMLFLIVLELGFVVLFGQYTLTQNSIALLYLLRLAFYMGLLFAATRVRKSWHLGIQHHVRWFVPVVIGVSVGQFVLFPSLWPLYPMGWDPHLYRMVGTVFDAAIAAGVYGMLFWLVALKRDLYSAKWRVLMMSALGVCVLLALSRAAYLGMIVSGAWLVITSTSLQHRLAKRMSYLVGGGAMVGVLLFALTMSRVPGEGTNLLRTSTIQSRLVDYREGFDLWRSHPLLGVGYNRIRAHKTGGYVTNDQVATLNHAGAAFHSSFLTLLAAGGVLGMVSYLLVLWVIARQHIVLRAQVIFLGVLSLFDNVLLHPIVLMLLAVAMAVCSVTKPSKPYTSRGAAAHDSGD
jgi:O-antigen ligase